MTAYLIPGLGADHRLFDEIQIQGYRVVHITLPVPQKGESMASYAKEISKQIDTSEKFILIGVSLGGMLASELAAFLDPEKVILISSAKSSAEIPELYKFQARAGINRLVPGWMIKYSSAVLQGIYETDSWKYRKFFRAMLLSKPSVYYKRTVEMIINWDRTESSAKIIHIHGTGDRTLPFRFVKPDHVVEKGSHMMVYTRAKEVSKILEQVLEEPRD